MIQRQMPNPHDMFEVVTDNAVCVVLKVKNPQDKMLPLQADICGESTSKRMPSLVDAGCFWGDECMIRVLKQRVEKEHKSPRVVTVYHTNSDTEQWESDGHYPVNAKPVTTSQRMLEKIVLDFIKSQGIELVVKEG